jgi:glycosyltransferase involved in cell wall biosynthesis
MADFGPVAVVIPVYNRRLKLLKTVASVAAQTKLPTLLVVVDDGSSDGSADMVEAWLTENAPFAWKVIRQANTGVAGARNAGFAEIGDLPFVCFLDSDDIWPPDFLTESLGALQANDEAVAAVSNKVKDVAGKESDVDIGPLIDNPFLWMIVRDGGVLSCSMLRSEAVRNAGAFVTGMHVSEDTDFYIRLFRHGSAVRSRSSPVRQIKAAPLESTEPPNLSHAFKDMTYLWACYRESVVRTLPPALFEQHGDLIRNSMAHRWAKAAFTCRRGHRMRRALTCLGYALKWDDDWARRARLIWGFSMNDKRILN